MNTTKAGNALSTPLVSGIATGCLLLLAGCATTGNQTGSATQATPDRFAQVDTNHDGKLSPTEASDYFVRQVFEGRDLNHDGKLTWAEWNVPGAGQSKARFNAADKDKDGSLSMEEALAYGRQRQIFAKEFKEADTNHDGFVTREEAKAYSASKEGPPQ